MHAARLALAVGGLAILAAAAWAASGDPVLPRPPDPVCTGFAEASKDGRLRHYQLTEVSGLIVHQGVRWVHNDSGDVARVFALDAHGKHTAIVSLAEVEAEDWEDIALGPGPDGTPHLYLGDIGDNPEFRDQILVHRLPVPDATVDAEVDPDSFVLRYPDRPHNAEVLLVDPRDGGVWIVTKADDGASILFSATLPRLETTVVLEERGRLSFPVERRGTAKATAGDISRDGRRIAIRTYTDAWLWERADGDLAEALATSPCRMPLHTEPQGEAIAFDDGDLLTVSEGAGARFWRYRVQ